MVIEEFFNVTGVTINRLVVEGVILSVNSSFIIFHWRFKNS